MATIAEIIHLSDVHFGPKNITQVVGPTSKPRNLAELVLRDLKQPPPPLPIVGPEGVILETPTHERIICITGDFAVTGSSEELDRAQQFLKDLYEGLGWSLENARARIVLIPGNHDLEWSKPDAALRWQTWRVFFDDFYGTKSPRGDALAWVRLVRIEVARAAVLCLDSEHHIHSNSEYRNCGVIDEPQIERVEELLEDAANDPWFREAIKVCLVHHHPILIPSLVELGRGAGQANNEPGYDAVFNAQRVLNLLHRHGFQVLLHGHKHIPHVFTEDIVNACHRTEDHSMIVVAGGTLGSDDQNSMDGWRQSYNRIYVHWSAARQSTRTEITTRGLVRKDPKTGVDLSWKDWHWITMRTVDRFSSPWLTIPSPNLKHQHPEAPYPKGSREDRERVNEYVRLRGNMPVVEVRPSLIPGQDYEAKFWITSHSSPRFTQKSSDFPTKVIWSAGDLFPKITIERSDDDKYCGVYHCYAPMLLQAEMIFPDGGREVAHVYARIPEEKR